MSTQCAAVITQFLFNKVPPHMCVKLSTQLFSVLLSNSFPLSSDLSSQSLTPSLTSLFLTQVPSQILLSGYLQPADLQSNCSETIKHETRCSKGRKLKKFQINSLHECFNTIQRRLNSLPSPLCTILLKNFLSTV